MSRNFGHRPTIELEPLSRDGVWVVREPAPERRSSRWGIRAVTMLLAAVSGVVVAGGVALVATSQVGWAQDRSWRPVTPGNAASLRDAVAAGAESGLSLYPCRGAYAGAMLVGRYRSDFGGCHVGYDGREIEVTPFEVLGPSWADIAEGPVAKALAAGEAATSPVGRQFASQSVFACRATYQGALHPGSSQASDKVCTFGYGGRVVASQNFALVQSAPWLTWAPGIPLALAEGAIIGGEEGSEPFYVCRAPTPGGLMAGKIKTSSAGCSVPFEGREVVESRFELLLPHWRVSSGGAIPVGAMVAGREGGELQFLCRGRSRNTLQPGRISERRAGCRVGMQGAEVVLQDYEVLSQ